MPDLQKQFVKFHDNIKLGNFDENQTLREKRDTLLKDLKSRIEENAPSFESFGQGSYAMNTGIVPKDGNYDIDVGIIFDCSRERYPDPVDLKKIVRNALSNGNRTVVIRRPCVTVTYMKNGKVDYHVDLAIYVKRNEDNLLDLAIGKEFSEEENKVWQKSDPKGLIDKINNSFVNSDDQAQMRRCIRYLKKWRDHNLHSVNSGKPFSIALTCSAYNWFQPSKDIFSGKYQDLDALLDLVKTKLSHFDSLGWLTISLPVEPYEDLNKVMTVTQMKTYKEKFANLRDALIAAKNEDLEDEVCKLLRIQFGDDFPVPEKKDTAKKAAVAGYAPAGGSA
ncbi:MAG: nucleotidyltransferase [Desulfobulbaceae bacterium]|nr:nucleotidyltransferase [Desulfobulbaceae bacterium]